MGKGRKPVSGMIMVDNVGTNLADVPHTRYYVTGPGIIALSLSLSLSDLSDTSLSTAAISLYLDE